MFRGKNFPQTACTLKLCSPVTKILQFAPVSTTALLLLLHPSAAQAQNCASSYAPGSQQQRVTTGLFDGRVGQIKVVNNTENAAIISLYHPDAPNRIFKYWYAEPGQSFLLSTDNYSSDWGIQVDEGPICIVGRVATWDSRMFTTFPSRLFIADALPTVASEPNADASRTQASTLTPSIQRPEAYEAIATEQIKEGQQRSGLISLLRAADLYRANGRPKDEQRVRDRIKSEVRGS